MEDRQGKWAVLDFALLMPLASLGREAGDGLLLSLLHHREDGLTGGT